MCKWSSVTLIAHSRANYILCTWPPYHTASQRVSCCLIVLFFTDIDCSFILFIPFNSAHIYGGTTPSTCLWRNKRINKNDPGSGVIPYLGVNSEKEKDRTYRKVLLHLDIFALWASNVVFCIIQNTGCFDTVRGLTGNKPIFRYISDAS